MHRRALLPFVLAPLAACSSTIHLQSSWTQWSWLGTEPETLSKVWTLECPADATSVRATFTSHGMQGELTMRLMDPLGTERHSQTVRSGRCEVSQHWPAQEGIWTLHVDAVDYAGSYSLELTSADTPIAVQVHVSGDSVR